MFVVSRRLAALTIALLPLLATAAEAAKKIVVITPYLAQPGTQFYVEAFQAEAKTNGWDVNVVDTKGDVAAVIGRLEDAANQKVDAIVINVDPSQQKRPKSPCSEWTPAQHRCSSPT
jgi:ribose transport system substrate-binding protein